MHHYFYEIRNKLNGKIYRGIHSTENLEDGYLGSGVGIRAAVKKYGKENFTKTILKEFNTREEAAAYEQANVDLSFINRKDTYNQITGGEKYQILGSKLSEEAKQKISESKIGVPRTEEANRKNSEARKQERWVHLDSTGEKLKIHVSELESYINAGWKRGMGHVRSEEFKEKARKAHLGKKLTQEHIEAIRKGNTGRTFSSEHKQKIAESRRGRKFIHKGDQRMFVFESELQDYLDSGWILGM